MKYRLRLHLFVLIIFELLLITIKPLHADANYTIAPPSSWVKPLTFKKPSSIPTEEISNGFYYYLLDRQIKKTNNVSYYYHSVKKVLNRSAIESASHIEIEYNPAYENIILHSIKLYRKSHVYEKLSHSKIKVLQREKDLENKIYNGIKSINIILDDIRVGDVIEFSYTLTDSSEVFKNKFYFKIYLPYDLKIHEYRDKLIWPQECPLYFKNHSTTLKPHIRIQGENREYVWEIKNPSLLKIDDYLPDWYNPYPLIEISEIADWGDIAKAEVPRYKIPQKLSPSLQSYIKNIATLTQDPAQRFITVLRFVQDEIRYMGFEEISNGRQPSDPSDVFQRRFGDCKDKTLLAITLLNALNIEAYPALVHTSKGKLLSTFLPTLLAFNHAIVVANIQGKQYWVDPTLVYQRGLLKNLVQVDYGHALIVSSKTTGLVKIPLSVPSKPTREIYETFDLEKGANKPCDLIVKTIYTSYSANNQRNVLAETSLKKLQESYLKYYAGYYPSIQVKKNLSVVDDEDKNQITIVEKYSIPNGWSWDEINKKWEISSYANELKPYLDSKGLLPRSTPLSLALPAYISKNVKLILPRGKYDVEPETDEIKDSAFYFLRKEKFKNNIYEVYFEYRNLEDHVKLANITSHIANLGKASNLLNVGWNIFDNAPSAPALSKLNDLNWIAIFLMIILTVFFTMIALRVYRYQPKFLVEDSASNLPLKGIQGWLILAGIDLLTLPIKISYEFFTEFDDLFYASKWIAIYSLDLHPFYVPLILTEATVNIAQFVFSILLNFLFFQKKRSLPILYICFIISLFLFNLCDSIIVLALEHQNIKWIEIAEMGGQLLSVLIWVSYFLKSKRVKATFVID